MQRSILVTIRNAALALLLTAVTVTPVAANDTLAVIGMINRIGHDQNRILNPNTSIATIMQIQRRYNYSTNALQGFVTQMEMRNRLAQRYYEEQAYRERIQRQEDADAAITAARSLLWWLSLRSANP